MIKKHLTFSFVLWMVCSMVPMALNAAPAREGEGYMARQESLHTFFDALSAPLGKPIVVSKAAARKSISGEFSLREPQRALESSPEMLLRAAALLTTIGLPRGAERAF